MLQSVITTGTAARASGERARQESSCSKTSMSEIGASTSFGLIWAVSLGSPERKEEGMRREEGL